MCPTRRAICSIGTPCQTAATRSCAAVRAASIGGIQACRGGDAAEPAPDVGGIEWGAGFGGEDETGVFPTGPSTALGALALVLLVQCFHAAFRQRQGAAGRTCLGVAANSYRAPYAHVGRNRWLGVRTTGEVDVAPGQRAEFLGSEPRRAATPARRRPWWIRSRVPPARGLVRRLWPWRGVRSDRWGSRIATRRCGRPCRGLGRG